MSFLLLLVLTIFSLYRVTTFLAFDYGPFNSMENIRVKLGVMATLSKFWKFVADLVNCPYCSGVWLSILFTVIFAISLRVTIFQWLLLITGIMGAHDLFISISGYNRN